MTNEHILTLSRLQDEGRLQPGDCLHSSVHGAMTLEHVRDVSTIVCKIDGSEQRVILGGFNFGPDARVTKRGAIAKN